MTRPIEATAAGDAPADDNADTPRPRGLRPRTVAILMLAVVVTAGILLFAFWPSEVEPEGVTFIGFPAESTILKTQTLIEEARR